MSFRPMVVHSTVLPELSTTLVLSDSVSIGSVEMEDIKNTIQEHLDHDATVIKARRDLEHYDGYAILFSSGDPLMRQRPDCEESYSLIPEVFEWLDYNLKDRHRHITYRFHTILYFDKDAEAATLFKVFWQ